MGQFSVYLLGAEVPGWRKLLGECGVHAAGVSYKGLRSRLPKTRPFDMSRWPPFEKLMLDSGAFGINKKAEMSVRDLRDYGADYGAFALAQAEHFTIISEFDSVALGPDYVAEQRAEVWAQLDPAKFMPIWHPEQGLDELGRLAEVYLQIGITPNAFTDRSVPPRLTQMAMAGVKLHGLAMTKPDVIRQGFFDSVSSTSWLSPLQYGDTIVFDGIRLQRYPNRMKQQARQRHRMLFEREGFDTAAIERDDPHEVARLTLWSWQQFERHIGAQRVGSRLNGSNYADIPSSDTEMDSGGVQVGVGVALPGREIATVVRATPRPPEERKTLPVFGFRDEEVTNEAGETVGQQSLPVLSHRALRVCDSCFIASRCPEYRAGSECAFELPLEVKTPQQRKALLDGLVELQGKRVAFMRLAEELSGGYADPNLSQEIDRLMKVFSTIADLEDTREFFKVAIEGKGNPGIISRLFGGDAAERASQLDRPLDSGRTDVAISRILEIEPA